jgi:hypothetical protein
MKNVLYIFTVVLFLINAVFVNANAQENPRVLNRTEMEKYDKCLRDYTPFFEFQSGVPVTATEGLQVLAGQYACQVLVRARNFKEYEAANCVAKKVNNIHSAADYWKNVDGCYTNMQRIHSYHMLVTCILKDYLTISSRQELAKLAENCQQKIKSLSTP